MHCHWLYNNHASLGKPRLYTLTSWLIINVHSRPTCRPIYCWSATARYCSCTRGKHLNLSVSNMWRGGVVVTASESLSRAGGFDVWQFHFHLSTRAKLFTNTWLCWLSCSIIWHWQNDDGHSVSRSSRAWVALSYYWQFDKHVVHICSDIGLMFSCSRSVFSS